MEAASFSNFSSTAGRVFWAEFALWAGSPRLRRVSDFFQRLVRITTPLICAEQLASPHARVETHIEQSGKSASRRRLDDLISIGCKGMQWRALVTELVRYRLVTDSTFV